MGSIQDQNLSNNLADGDERAFKLLFDLFYQRVANFSFNYLKDKDLAKDVAQNVFVKVYSQRSLLKGVRDLQAYMYRAAYNECIDEKRRSKRSEHRHKLFAEALALESGVENTELEYRLFCAIEQLPPRCKEIFLLSRMDGKKNDEIAEMLDLSRRTVETQISIALKMLRDTLVFVVLSISLF